MAPLQHGAYSYSDGPTIADVEPHSDDPLQLGQVSSIPKKKLITLADIFHNYLTKNLESSADLGQYSDLLPHVAFWPRQAATLQLPLFKDEACHGLVVGNISPDNYVDIFWEIVKQQEGTAEEIFVYETSLDPPRFVFWFKHQTFELDYYQCSSLAREHNELYRVPDSFVNDPANKIPNDIARIVRTYKDGRKLLSTLDRHPWLRWIYYYLKEWAAIRGLYGHVPLLVGSMFNAIITAHLDKKTDDPVVLLPELFHEFAPEMDSYANDDIRALYAELSDAKGSTDKWKDALGRLNQLSVQEKINCPHLIRLSVVYCGISPLLGAEWLLEVERRLSKLKERLEIPKIASVHVWPQRLIRSDFDYGHDRVYEGSFVVGLRTWTEKDRPPGKPVDMSKVRETTTRWIEQTSRATSRDFLLLAHYENLPELKPCTKTWPRRVLRGDIDDDDDEVNEEKEIQGLPNNATTQNGEPGQSLRPAKDVLNRLKYDDIFNLDEFVIGYKDRVKNKIVEKNAIDWEKNSTTEEWIPEHRIEYFKRISVAGDEVIVWQKKTKLDLIFGTGGE